MRKIYLASRSKARARLFAMLGLPFKAMASAVREKRAAPRASYIRLVQDNALAKARDVASRVGGGIIIGADTITVQGSKIYGKPKNVADARRMLKKLSRKPQIMYTGLAVIDKDNNKTYLAYEKTKVFMDRLSDREIERYFRHTSVLDKAGSFDIQGRGACFVRRVEGCFYTVVGLPVRTLYRILKDMKVKVFVCVLCALNFSLCALVSGCSTEYNKATNRQETFFYSTDREVTLGRAISKEVEKEYKLADDPLLQDRLKTIGNKIVAVCDRKDIDYHFAVLKDDEVNAVSLPGGYVYVNSGLIEKTDTDDELAGVVAHEVGHIVARHSVKKLQALMGYSLFQVLASQIPGGGNVVATANAAFTQLVLGYGREDELLADTLGARYAVRAGYNPQGMIDFLEKLKEVNRRKPLREKSYFKTHPYVPDRIRVVKQELGKKMDFVDYINIEEVK
jgi:MAF protein